MAAKTKKLTTKQQRFVDFYDGNAVDACRLAGYTHPESASRTLVQNNTIMELIFSREKKRKKSTIATREERQAFWTTLMEGAKKDTDRLKASELLGKSEADFVERHREEGELTIRIVKYVDIES